MITIYNEEQNEFIVDMTDVVLLVDGALDIKDHPSLHECDCTPKVLHKFSTILDVNKINVWNLMFNKNLKRALKQFKDESKRISGGDKEDSNLHLIH